MPRPFSWVAGQLGYSANGFDVLAVRVGELFLDSISGETGLLLPISVHYSPFLNPLT